MEPCRLCNRWFFKGDQRTPVTDKRCMCEGVFRRRKGIIASIVSFFFFFLFCLSWKVLRRSEDPFLFIFGDLQNKKLAAENAKLQYRIQHLVQAVRDGDDKLEKLKVSYNL